MHFKWLIFFFFLSIHFLSIHSIMALLFFIYLGRKNLICQAYIAHLMFHENWSNNSRSTFFSLLIIFVHSHTSLLLTTFPLRLHWWYRCFCPLYRFSLSHLDYFFIFLTVLLVNNTRQLFTMWKHTLHFSSNDIFKVFCLFVPPELVGCSLSIMCLLHAKEGTVWAETKWNRLTIILHSTHSHTVQRSLYHKHTTLLPYGKIMYTCDRMANLHTMKTNKHWKCQWEERASYRCSSIIRLHFTQLCRWMYRSGCVQFKRFSTHSAHQYNWNILLIVCMGLFVSFYPTWFAVCFELLRVLRQAIRHMIVCIHILLESTIKSKRDKMRA